jgi:gliding motility-associated-like protein
MIKNFLVIFFFSFVKNANSQTIDFTFQSTSGLFCTPSTIVFKQTCTGNPESFIWSFGNNLYSDKPIDSTTYLSPGTYTVKLIAVFNKTALELIKNIVINPAVTATIGFDRNYLCQPGAINFTGSGTGNIANYEWNFGDGSAIVNTPSAIISHNYLGFGTSNVTLKTKSPAGCTDNTSTSITIKKFAIGGTVSDFRGCIPAVIKFTGSVTLPVNSSVKSYTWDFGDGSSPYISNYDTAGYTYLKEGEYYPTLTIITNEGCSNTYNYGRLYFGSPPTNHVVYSQSNPVCGSDSVVFFTHSTNGTRYYWNFLDGSPVVSSYDTIIKHKFNTIGDKIIYIEPDNNGCLGPLKVSSISIIGVIAKYSYFNTCLNKNTYSFSDTSSGIPTSSMWDFGDGIKTPDSVNTIHNFPQSGQFKTTLFLNDTVSGCTDSISKMIYTARPVLFCSDSSVCINTPVSFSILNNYTNPASAYTWNVVGEKIGPMPNAGITLNTDTLGIFNNYVSINYGKESCPDTVDLKRTILVRGPSLNFAAPTPICLNTPLLVTNNSQPFIPKDSIKLWYWNFGNSNKNDTVFQPSPYLYALEGAYDVQLTAVDKNGCRDTLTKIVQVNPAPYLHILPASAKVCYGKSLTLVAYHNNELLWTSDNSLSCTACDTTIATPLISAKYYAIATNSFGCSVKDSSTVEVVFPFTATAAPADVYVCLKEAAIVDINPKGKKVLWSPVAGLSNATAYDPVISPGQNTTYTVTLTDSAGCLNSSSTTVNVQVKSLPSVNAGTDKFFPKGTPFTFAPTFSSNVNTFLWTPSSLLNCNSCATPNGVANYSQKYTLKVTSDSGCVASDDVLIGIECKSANIFIPKAFSPNNDNLNDIFYPITIGIKSISKFTIYNRQGQIVYEAQSFSPNDKSFGWNGKFKGVDQAVDTYMYTLEALCEIGEKLFKRDSFVLIK